MREVLQDNIKKLGTIRTLKYVISFSEWCPYCTEKVIFTTKQHLCDPERITVSSSSQCPGCDEHIGVWSVTLPGEDKIGLFIHPNYSPPHQVKDVETTLSEQLYRSYKSTVDSYNSGNYVATATGCRRTLEGLFKGFLPEKEKKQSLYQAIQYVAKSDVLSEPINKLANVLRKGGNLGAHFNEEKEPDQSMAFQMLKLLENIIDYLRVLPTELSNLENELDKGSKTPAELTSHPQQATQEPDANNA